MKLLYIYTRLRKKDLTREERTDIYNEMHCAQEGNYTYMKQFLRVGMRVKIQTPEMVNYNFIVKSFDELYCVLTDENGKEINSTICNLYIMPNLSFDNAEGAESEEELAYA